MKRWIALIVGCLLLFSGCSEKSEKQPILSGDFDNSGNKTVVFCGDKEFVLSYSIDGKQQIENGTYWFYELKDEYDFRWEEPFYTYDLENRMLNGSVQFDELKNCFATNGNWPLFLNPVHTEYSETTQNQVDEKILMQAGKAFAEDLNPVVQDIWKCDLDGDQKEELLFCSSAGDGAERYLGFFDGGNCQGLYHGKAETVTPLICDLNGDGKWSLLLYEKGNYERFISYDYSNGNFIKTYEIIF